MKLMWFKEFGLIDERAHYAVRQRRVMYGHAQSRVRRGGAGKVRWQAESVHEAFGEPCPCGTGQSYHVCCGPLHHGERHAATAEELMRSRYSAYARGDSDYLFRTWHPRTRPRDPTAPDDVVWTGLDVTDSVAGDDGDERGEVAFTATFAGGVMRERSRFERRAGRWFYVDGDVR